MTQFTGPPVDVQVLSVVFWVRVMVGPLYPAAHVQVYDVAPREGVGFTALGYVGSTGTARFTTSETVRVLE